MKHQRQEHIDEIQVSPGVVVTVQVDSRDVSHPQGFKSVVFHTKEDTGGVQVVCAAGLLCSTNAKKEYWMPFDKSKVIARAHEQYAMTHDLLMIRYSILAGEFNMITCDRTTF